MKSASTKNINWEIQRRRERGIRRAEKGEFLNVQERIDHTDWAKKQRAQAERLGYDPNRD